MSDRYDRYQRLQFDWPAPRVLRITLHSPLKMGAMMVTSDWCAEPMYGSLARNMSPGWISLSSKCSRMYLIRIGWMIACR